jgi:tRNA1(Val) A37 N6-methylase TrmN6
MNINRSWAMPNKDTFSILPIGDLIDRYLNDPDLIVCDPFSNGKRMTGKTITNDLDPDKNSDHQLDALEFLKIWDDKKFDVVLFDPPYSPRQVSECYKKLNKSVNMQTTQSSYWGNMKKEISRIIKPDGIVITCGWNSGGIGKKYNMEIEEILLVAHGGWHNDTIITVERKKESKQLELF